MRAITILLLLAALQLAVIADRTIPNIDDDDESGATAGLHKASAARLPRCSWRSPYSS